LRYAGVECHDENEIDPHRNRCGKLTLSSAAFAQTAQMTGQIIALTSDKITVQKGKEVWDINLSASTKVSGDKSRLDCDGHLQCAGRSKKRISLSAFAFVAGRFFLASARRLFRGSLSGCFSALASDGQPRSTQFSVNDEARDEQDQGNHH
jgi:hypothetical protein